MKSAFVGDGIHGTSRLDEIISALGEELRIEQHSEILHPYDIRMSGNSTQEVYEDCLYEV